MFAFSFDSVYPSTVNGRACATFLKVSLGPSNEGALVDGLIIDCASREIQWLIGDQHFLDSYREDFDSFQGDDLDMLALLILQTLILRVTKRKWSDIMSARTLTLS